jgi:hypothetical protein
MNSAVEARAGPLSPPLEGAKQIYSDSVAAFHSKKIDIG